MFCFRLVRPCQKLSNLLFRTLVEVVAKMAWALK